MLTMNRRQLSAWLATLPLSATAAAGFDTVAAASDLRFVLDALAQQFQRDTGQAVRLVYGSSGNLFAQLAQGAPFGMFMSADEALVARLAEGGKTQDAGQLYGIGRLVLVVSHTSALKPDGSLADLGAAQKDGRLHKFAIANPEHAPYGARARETLQALGLWEALQRHLVFGENVSQAAQFALSGSAQGGIVALSLAKVPQFAALGRYGLIDDRLHQPLRQRMVLLRTAGTAVRRFYGFLGTPAARAIMAQSGFVVPRE